MPEIKTVEQKKSQHYAVKQCDAKGFIVKDVDTVGRTVTGFYNTFNYFDSDYDVLLPGCAKKSISERGPKSDVLTGKIKHALFHNLTRLPGKIKTLEEREVNGLKGIYFETKMSDTSEGNDTLKNYLEGIYDNHSIGFQYLQVEMVDRDAKKWESVLSQVINREEAEKAGVLFLIKEIALYEGSTVAFGANRLTPYLGVKSGNKDSLRLALADRLDQLYKTLKSGTQSDEMMSLFELQTLQLKQMVDELVDTVTLQKGTHGEPSKEENGSAGVEPIVAKALDLSYVTENLKLTL